MNFEKRLMRCLIVLIILSSISAVTCKPKIQTVPVAIGEARIVGKIVSGFVTFEPGENPAGSYFIITKAFWYETYKLAWKVRALELEIEKLKAKGEK